MCELLLGPKMQFKELPGAQQRAEAQVSGCPVALVRHSASVCGQERPLCQICAVLGAKGSQQEVGVAVIYLFFLSMMIQPVLQ